MFYQVLIETSEKVGKHGNYKQFFELDKTDLSEIEDDIVVPYLQGRKFQFDGYFMQPNEIKRIVVKQTQRTTSELSDSENDNRSLIFTSRKDIVAYDKYTTDITKQVFSDSQAKIDSGSAADLNFIEEQEVMDKHKVFIVHGHDDLAKVETARFIEQMGFEPIVLHEQASSGDTIVEKIEKYSNVGFGVVLYTPCDVGGAKAETEPQLRCRARQNVVFEHGFLNGKLGRQNVCALVKGEIEIPNDISGVVYVSMDNHGAWKLVLAKEMRNSGYDVNMNLVV